jgi:phi13 family phage major tail protein
MADSKKANRFNIKRIVYALVLKDDATGYNHGPIKTFGVPMAAQFTPSYASGTLYGAGAKTEDITKLNGGVLKVDANKVFIETRAEIYGHTYTAGVLEVNKDDQAKDIAVGYELESTGDNAEYVWFPKCKARPFGNNNQQSTDNMNFSTDTIDIAVMARDFDGAIHFDADTANVDFTSTAAATFLDMVPDGTLVTGA